MIRDLANLLHSSADRPAEQLLILSLAAFAVVALALYVVLTALRVSKDHVGKR